MILRINGGHEFGALGLCLVAALAPQAARAGDQTPLNRDLGSISLQTVDLPTVYSVSEPLAPQKKIAESDFVKARRWVFRQLLSPRTGPATASDAISAAISQAHPSVRQTPSMWIRIADTDPNFSIWQKHATERLKSEDNPVGEDPATPAALAHPDDFVIVCEAGCREKDAPDHIVYMVSKVAASTGLSSTRKLEPTAGEVNLAGNKKSGDIVGDQNVILCVAGCYDTPKSYVGREGEHARAEPVRSRRYDIASLETTSTNGTEVAQATLPVKKHLRKLAVIKSSIRHRRLEKAPRNGGWQVSVIRTPSPSRGAGVVRPKHLAHVQALKIKAERRHSMAKALTPGQ